MNPVLVELQPDTAFEGFMFMPFLFGEGFEEGAVGEFSLDGETWHAMKTHVVPTEGEAEVELVPVPAVARFWLRLKNPDGQTSNALPAQVKKEAPRPHIEAIYPRAVDTVYGPTIPMQIVGHPFHPRATVLVRVNGGDWRQCDIFTDRLLYRLTAPNGIEATPGTWAIKVVNPDGKESNAYSLPIV